MSLALQPHQPCSLADIRPPKVGTLRAAMLGLFREVCRAPGGGDGPDPCTTWWLEPSLLAMRLEPCPDSTFDFTPEVLWCEVPGNLGSP